MSTYCCTKFILGADSFARLTDQGTTPVLSKFWMPLEEYTKHTIEGLVRGDPEVAVGMSAAVLEKYEKGKREAVEQAYVRETPVFIPS